MQLVKKLHLITLLLYRIPIIKNFAYCNMMLIMFLKQNWKTYLGDGKEVITKILEIMKTKD